MSFEKNSVDINTYRKKKGAKGTFSVLTIALYQCQASEFNTERIGTYSNAQELVNMVNETLVTAVESNISLNWDVDYEFEDYYPLVYNFFGKDNNSQENFATVLRVYPRSPAEGKEIYKNTKMLLKD